MVIELLLSYFPLAIAIAFMDVISSTLAKQLSRRWGNGLAYLIAWFATSAICFSLGIGAFRGLAWLMETDNFGPYHALGHSLTLFASIVVPPVWLNYNRDVVFVRRGSWRLPTPGVQILGVASLLSIAALTLNLAFGRTAFDDVDWLTYIPFYFAAILVGGYVLGHYLGRVPDARPAPRKEGKTT